MSLATVNCRACTGMDSPTVQVEVHLAGGLPAFCLVGVPETAVRESKDRVRSAIINSGFKFPARRITVNLAPANVPKEGGRFDLAIAVGILAASGQIETCLLDELELYGELSLGGGLRPIRGALSVAIAATRAGISIVLPAKNAEAAARVESCCVWSAESLAEVAGFLQGSADLNKIAASNHSQSETSGADLSDVRGQPLACRALEIAAAGGHHMLMIGPPGSGKSMIASRLPSILPALTTDESLQSATLFDVAGVRRDPPDWNRPVFRAPHHTLSAVALVGGGRIPMPGEISLAHRGVLFLDELPEFSRQTLEVLRQPLEQRFVNLSRAAGRVTYPSAFQLIAAMNPCPCGYQHDTHRECRCAPDQVSRYLHKVSGPLLDRIDLHLMVPRPSTGVLAGEGTRADDSATVRARVVNARERQLARGELNCNLSARTLTGNELVSETARQLLKKVADKRGLSARSWFRALKVARTIADLARIDVVSEDHLAEALTLRLIDWY